MNKTRSHLRIFFKKKQLIPTLNLQRLFIPAKSITWIFFIFRSSKIRVSPTSVVSSLSPPRCRLSSDRRRHTVAPCHTSFPLSQDELATSTSSFGNALSCRLPSLVETEALNHHHCHRLSSPDLPTLTLHWYKNIISTLATLHITQLHLHFTSFLARAPRHQSSTHRRCSLLPLSHTHRPSTQRHLWWWTSRPSFASRTAYRHVNSRKNIFWNAADIAFPL
jgi:hypothetical protein